MPSQGGAIFGKEDDEDVAEVFTSVDPLTQDHHQPYRYTCETTETLTQMKPLQVVHSISGTSDEPSETIETSETCETSETWLK